MNDLALLAWAFQTSICGFACVGWFCGVFLSCVVQGSSQSGRGLPRTGLHPRAIEGWTWNLACFLACIHWWPFLQTGCWQFIQIQILMLMMVPCCPTLRHSWRNGTMVTRGKIIAETLFTKPSESWLTSACRIWWRRNLQLMISFKIFLCTCKVSQASWTAMGTLGRKGGGTLPGLQQPTSERNGKSWEPLLHYLNIMLQFQKRALIANTARSFLNIMSGHQGRQREVNQYGKRGQYYWQRDSVKKWVSCSLWLDTLRRDAIAIGIASSQRVSLVFGDSCCAYPPGACCSLLAEAWILQFQQVWFQIYSKPMAIPVFIVMVSPDYIDTRAMDRQGTIYIDVDNVAKAFWMIGLVGIVSPMDI